MKWRKLAGALLALPIVLWCALLVSGLGVLVGVTDTTRPPRPNTADEQHGVLPTFRCHYFTATGKFSHEGSMAFGAESCSPLKRPSASSLGFTRSGFF